MKKLKYIEIFNKKCWIIYLKPGTDLDVIKIIQNECIKNNFFGMGWHIEGIPANRIPDQKIEKQYLDGNKEAKNAFNLYKSIEKNDVVIMRNLDAHYYIGEVSTKMHYVEKNNKDLSWICNVFKWYDLGTDENVSGDIVGRFSQRFHSTIQQVSNERLKILLIQLLQSQKDATYKFRKILLNKETFALALNYQDLEDLVFDYLRTKEKYKHYILYPSSCKTNKIKYEFTLFNPETKDKISCQVKNNAEIDISKYSNNDGFTKIYLFSGLWSEKYFEKIEITKNSIVNNKHIELIKPSQLFEVLKNNPRFDFENISIYIFAQPSLNAEMLNNIGWHKVNRWGNKNWINGYSENDYGIYFEKNNQFHYSKTYDCLIINNSLKDLDDKAKNTIKKLEHLLS